MSVVYALADHCAIVMSAGLTALRRSSWTLGSAVLGNGVLAAVAGPAAQAWGLNGLWLALIAGSLIAATTQTAGFLRFSAR
ncbi:hypothetical protein [Nonomuraea sp. NPDC049607]|uniref:hypothetical protein n=1 Tax=Nonomuraea sp. NPDC049607 TaxID=3154732 RepID=UPI00341AB582